MRPTRRGRFTLALLGASLVGVVVAVVVSSLGPNIIVPDDPCAEPPPLRTRRGVTLQPLAMQAFRKAERLAGMRIGVVESHRSCARQARACRRICGNRNGCPGRCAEPGTSYHQLGAAIDVTEKALGTPRIVQGLEEAGWCQSVPDSDPGHFSFDGCH